MSTYKEKLEKAIITRKWAGVEEVYEHLFDIKPPKPLEEDVDVDSVVRGVIEQVRYNIDELLKRFTVESINSESQVIEKEAVVEEKKIDTKRKEKKGTAKNIPKNTPKKDVQFISSVSNEETEEDRLFKEAAEKWKQSPESKNRKRVLREPYQPEMVKCELCGADFDAKKEYGTIPAFGNRTITLRCNDCGAKGAGKS